MFPVRYELNLYIRVLFRRNSVFKGLMSYSGIMKLEGTNEVQFKI
jgi:hypothetical protein